MSELRDFYTEECGYTSKELVKLHSYISQLVIHAAIELDNQRTRGNANFEHLEELADIFAKRQLQDDGAALKEYSNWKRFYSPLLEAMRNKSCKKISSVPELALEMRLFRYELETAPEKPERRGEMVSLLCELSKQLRWADERCYCRWIA